MQAVGNSNQKLVRRVFAQALINVCKGLLEITNVHKILDHDISLVGPTLNRRRK